MSNVSVGLVGLPNVGKSTLFNALVKTAQAEAANFPFTTIEPNTGVVAVPDDNLVKLAEVAKSGRIVPAAVTFIDIAGLVAGAHKGEGLGNAFLANIRDCAAIAEVVRCFADENVIHVAGQFNPAEDIQTIELELLLADLQTLEKAKNRAESAKKSGDKTEILRAQVIDKLYSAVEAEQPANSVLLTDEEEPFRHELQLLTAKPVLYVANVAEAEANLSTEDCMKTYEIQTKSAKSVVVLSAKLEAEIASLPESEQAEFLALSNLTEPGLNRLINYAYNLLGLQSFYTAGEMEARAWTIPAGATALAAAGEIHTDFMKKFIKAEVVSLADFLTHGGWVGARSAGKVRLEGKEYVMRPDDVVYFKIGA